MRNRNAALLIALLSLVVTPLLPTPVAAQRDGRGAVQRLASALSTMSASVGHRRGGQGHVAQMERTVARMSQMLERRGALGPRILSRLDEQHRAARARLLSRFAGDDRVMDAWEEVVIAKARVRRHAPVAQHVGGYPGGHPGDQPFADPGTQPIYQPVHHRRTWVEFSGSFEGTPVRFEGESVQNVHAQCTSYMNNVFRTVNVDDIVIFGTAHRNGPRFWSERQLCAIVALNARGGHGASVTGQIEREVPFSITGSADEVRRRLSRYLPVLMPVNVDDVWVNGQHFRNGPGFWSADEIAYLVSSQATSSARPTGRRAGQRVTGRRSGRRR